MAKIVLLSMAYAGDVHPFAPVASELANRGHDVTFVAPREFHDSFASEPFACAHSGSDFGPSALNQHGPWLAKWGMRLGGARLLELYFGEFTVPHLDAQFDAVHSALEGADVLFSHSTAAVVGAMAAEARNIPWISGDLFPMLIPTATRSPIAAITSLGPLNKVAWRIAQSTRPERLTYSKAFAGFRRKKGLDATVRSAIEMRISPHLNLGMASPAYIPPAPDWPANYHLTGFTHWENEGAELPAGLQDFLDDGPPPLLITLGTLAAAAFPERFDAAVRAAQRQGIRTVSLCSLDSTVDHLRATYDPEQHGAWRFAPLAKVLPHVCGVVHSGSHGTNSMALTAGLPSVISPAIVDQVWHAKRQTELGTGVHAKRASDLDEAIERILTDGPMRRVVEAFGAELRLESGSTHTADRIEAFLA